MTDLALSAAGSAGIMSSEPGRNGLMPYDDGASEEWRRRHNLLLSDASRKDR